MRRFLALTRVLWKNGQNPNKKEKKTALGKAGTMTVRLLFLAAAVLVVCLCLFTAMSSFPEDISARSQAVKQVFITNTILVLLSGVPMILSYFFLSKDVPLYLHMPFNGREIVGAKLMMAMMTGVVLAVLVTVPELVGFGIKSGSGAAYYVMAAVIALLLPVIPTVLISAAAILLMNLLRNTKNKDAIVTVVTYGITACVLLAPMLGNSGTDSGFLDNVISNPLIETIMTVLCPAAGLGTKALLEKDWMSFGLFLLLNIVSVLVFMLLADAFYIKSVLVGTEGGSMKTKEGIHLDFEPRKLSAALLHKENQMFFRSPVCLMNSLTNMLVIPVILVVGIVMAFIQGGESMMVIFERQEFRPVTMLILPILYCLILGLIASMNRITPTSISREGEGYYLLKAMPIQPKMLYRAKRKTGLLMSFAVCGVTALVLGGFLVAAGTEPAVPVMLLIECAAIVVLVNNIQMVYACKNPMLIWDTEENVIRQSGLMTTFLSVNFVFLSGMIGCGVIFFLSRQALAAAVFWCIWIVAAAVVSEIVGTKKGIKMMQKIGG